MKRLLKEQNIILLGYRPIRDLQRAGQKAGAGK